MNQYPSHRANWPKTGIRKNPVNENLEEEY